MLFDVGYSCTYTWNYSYNCDVMKRRTLIGYQNKSQRSHTTTSWPDGRNSFLFLQYWRQFAPQRTETYLLSSLALLPFCALFAETFWSLVQFTCWYHYGSTRRKRQQNWKLFCQLEERRAHWHFHIETRQSWHPDWKWSEYNKWICSFKSLNFLMLVNRSQVCMQSLWRIHFDKVRSEVNNAAETVETKVRDRKV